MWQVLKYLLQRNKAKMAFSKPMASLGIATELAIFELHFLPVKWSMVVHFYSHTDILCSSFLILFWAATKFWWLCDREVGSMQREHPAGAELVATATWDRGTVTANTSPVAEKLAREAVQLEIPKTSCQEKWWVQLWRCWASTGNVVWLEQRKHHSGAGWRKALGMSHSWFRRHSLCSWWHWAVEVTVPMLTQPPRQQGTRFLPTGKTFPIINTDRKKIMRIDRFSDSN